MFGGDESNGVDALPGRRPEQHRSRQDNEALAGFKVDTYPDSVLMADLDGRFFNNGTRARLGGMGLGNIGHPDPQEHET